MRKNTSALALALSMLAGGIAGAQAADLRPIMKAPPAPVVVAYNWTGFYVGMNAGAVWGRAETSSYTGDLAPLFLTTVPGVGLVTIVGSIDTLPGATATNLSWLAGGQAGYNWHSGNFLIGIEGDAVATGLRMTSTATNTRFPGTTVEQTVASSVTTDIDWMASLRLRLGLTSDRVLFYVTGGGAVAEIDVSTLTTTTFGPGTLVPAPGTYALTNSASTTRFGWTIGGGIEWAFDNNWSLGGEYRYSDFGRITTSFGIPDGFGTAFATGTRTTRVTTSQATLRLNYRFGGPVVARY
jgi:outer membrane immunogenic protein